MPARASFRPARVAASLLVPLILVGCAACGPMEAPSFDPQRPDVVAERGRARIATADALATVTGGRLTVASARIDSCHRGEDNWKRQDPWALRCQYDFATAWTVADLPTAASAVTDGLTALQCEDPGQLAVQVARWAEINPGEPRPGQPDFRPGVVPPILTTCGDLEVWVRTSGPGDPLLELTAGQAAGTTDPVVVSARPFTDHDLDRLRSPADGSRVVLFVTVSQTYHEEPR